MKKKKRRLVSIHLFEQLYERGGRHSVGANCAIREGRGWLVLEAVVIRRAIMDRQNLAVSCGRNTEFCRDCVGRLRNVDVDKGGDRKRGGGVEAFERLHLQSHVVRMELVCTKDDDGNSAAFYGSYAARRVM